MLKGQNFSGALPPEPPPVFRHESPICILEHSKTQIIVQKRTLVALLE